MNTIMPSQACRSAPRSMQGVTLLEVLITIIILAFGLLGIAGLQAKALTAELEAYQRAQAIILVQDMVDRIQVRRKSAATYVFSGFVGDAGSYDCGSGDPVKGDCAAWDLLLKGASEKVGTDNRGAMIGARGCVTVNGGIYTVTVTWQGTVPTSAPADTCAQNTYKDATGTVNDALRRAISVQFRIADQAAT